MKTYAPFRFYLSLLLLSAVFIAGCSKKAPIPPPPPPPSGGTTAAPAAPGTPTVANFTVEPSSVERGQSAVVRWSVSDATSVSIDRGFGTVEASGSRRVTPTDTTTYTLTATGTAGNTTRTATVTVTAPAPPPAPVSNNSGGARGTLDSRVQSDLQDALFDYDSNNIRDDARAALTANAAALKRIFADFPGSTINVEGHCDERGSAEYNLGLGDRRASAAMEFLVQLGVPADRLKTISYGKERPTCTESNESCWQKNRRAHFSSGQ
ncbi:MAG: OmpA family protein [Bryobacteraceae bacterium]|jgi:peptidoglycan-associated lipoprotein